MAEELQLKGLMGNADEKVENEDVGEKSLPLHEMAKPNLYKANISHDQEISRSKSLKVKTEGTAVSTSFFLRRPGGS